MYACANGKGETAQFLLRELADPTILTHSDTAGQPVSRRSRIDTVLCSICG